MADEKDVALEDEVAKAVIEETLADADLAEDVEIDGYMVCPSCKASVFQVNEYTKLGRAKPTAEETEANVVSVDYEERFTCTGCHRQYYSEQLEFRAMG